MRQNLFDVEEGLHKSTFTERQPAEASKQMELRDLFGGSASKMGSVGEQVPETVGTTTGQTGAMYPLLLDAVRTCLSRKLAVWLSVESLEEQCKNVRPIHLRVGDASGAVMGAAALAAQALCPFRSADLDLSPGDQFLVTDRSDSTLWKV